MRDARITRATISPLNIVSMYGKQNARLKYNVKIPFSSIIHEKNCIVHRYMMGSILARNAICVLVQPKTILVVVAIGPYVFHAQY